MAPHTSLPHPLLLVNEPVLYVANPPGHLTWEQVQATFTGSGCGTVRNLGPGTVKGKPGQRRWGIRFIDVYYAEMALATMQGALVTNHTPPWKMVLSHSPTLASSTPSISIFSQYLETCPGFFTPDLTTQLLFRFFRPAGPLVRVRMNVNVGSQKRTAVVEYWNESHANTARLHQNALHNRMRSRPAFSLRTFDPCSLHCSGLGSSVSQEDLVASFSPFGSITSVTVYPKTQKASAYGIVGFSSLIDAAHALEAMDGRTLHGSTLTLRYEEPETQDVFRGTTRPTSSHPNKSESNGTPSATTDIPPFSPWPEHLREEVLARELKESADRQAKEASARADAEAKVKRREEQLLRKEQVEHAYAQVKEKLEIAMEKGRTACTRVDLAEKAQGMADKELEDARNACAEAKRAWLKASDREVAATRQAVIAQKATNDAMRWKEEVGARVDAAKQEEMSIRGEKEKLAAELEKDKLGEETIRLAELAESIRRMQELRNLDLAEEKERARRKQQAAEEQMRREKQAAEEKLRLEREEVERQARERHEREEKVRLEAEARQRLYKQAVVKEQARCRLRDTQFYPSSSIIIWHEQRALERFKLVSDEFDALKFQESLPLTFDSVPWPILIHPRAMTFDVIDWGAVERFFNAIEKLLQDKSEYKALVEKAHRRFHPDKWRSRGILNSVLDDDLRGRLEAAGNVVAQAITPLWLKSRE